MTSRPWIRSPGEARAVFSVSTCTYREWPLRLTVQPHMPDRKGRKPCCLCAFSPAACSAGDWRCVVVTGRGVWVLPSATRQHQLRVYSSTRFQHQPESAGPHGLQDQSLKTAAPSPPCDFDTSGTSRSAPSDPPPAVPGVPRSPLLRSGHLLEPTKHTAYYRSVIAKAILRLSVNSQMKRLTRQGPEKDGGLCPRGVETRHPPGTWICSQSLKLSESHTLGIFTESSSHRHSRLFTRFLAPLLSLVGGGGVGAAISKLLITGCSFQRPAPIQEPTTTRAKSAAGNPKGFRNWGQRPDIRRKDAPRIPIYTGLRSSGTRPETNVYIL